MSNFHTKDRQLWRDRCTDETAMTALEQQAGLDHLTARLLAGRGVKPEQAATFLSPTLRGQLPDPSLVQDMDKAANMIVEAVSAKKAITVFADYDVDGGTSAAQLIRWGRAMGVEFGLYVPDRVEEGYGPSVQAFEQLKTSGVDLVVTVDCGAAAHTALAAAQKMALPIIVIDHHVMEGPPPPAQAIVNPNRLDDKSGLGHLAAAGVTFMLLVALNRAAKRKGMSGTPDLLDYLGFVALGTICDVVSLTGLNRAFVAQGLKILSQRKNVGIEALSDVAGVSGAFATYHAGFVLGPRINAGGRIGRANMGAELLSTDDAKLAGAHAAELERVNIERKAVQENMLQEAFMAACEYKDDPVLVVAMQGWHPGIIGIVAGRLKDRFNVPSIVIGIDENRCDKRALAKGSGRSIVGVDLGGAIIAAKKAGIIESGGGHVMAGGLSMMAGNIDELRRFLCQRLKADVRAAQAGMALDIDSWIVPTALTMDLVELIERVGPYGSGNPQPVFAMADMQIAYSERLRGGHVRCAFEDRGGARVNGICFRADESGLADILLSPTMPRVHIAGRVKQESWKGRIKIDFQIVDIIAA